MVGSEDSSTHVHASTATPAVPGAPPADGPANPAALTVEQLARMLGVPEETIRRHLAAGAPASADGRVNLVHYAAWLNKELAKDDGD